MEESGTYKKYLFELIRVFFILLLVYAATTKIREYEVFKSQLTQFPYLGSYAEFIAWAVPAIEILVALFFFSYKYVKIGLYGSLGLMLMFSFYIITVLKFAESIPCSCGGIIASFSWKEHLTFNIACAILAFLGILLWQNNEKIMMENF